MARAIRLLATLLILNVVSGYGRAADLITIEPRPTSSMLLNPGKGWSASGLAKWQPQEVLDIVGMGVIRFEWATLEPREGEYNWKPVDDALADWARLGKVCNIGVMCASTHSKQPGGFVTPKWVFDAGAKSIEISLDPKISAQGTPGQKIAPVFDDPVFLAKLKNFVQAMARRYDGDPRIAVYDIRSYGNWGEAHMHPFKVPDIAPEKFREHVELHCAAFQKTQLCLSRNSHLGKYGPLKEVFDWAVTAKHIAPRRDGICGNSDGRETAIGLGIAPGVFEMFDNYELTKERGWWDGIKDKNGMGFRLEECIENGHPTWVDLSRGGKSGLHMWQENRALLERLTNRIGYHFHLQKAAFPRTVTENFELEWTWANRGTAPIYIPCEVALALLNEKDQPVVTVRLDRSLPRTWEPDKTTTEKLRVAFGKVPAGNYRLGLSLRTMRGDQKPAIRIGSDLPSAGDWSILGQVQMSP